MDKGGWRGHTRLPYLQRTSLPQYQRTDSMEPDPVPQTNAGYDDPRKSRTGLRTHFHDAPRNMAIRHVLLHPAMHSQVPWDTWPRDADHWATYFLRLWECMGPPPDLLRQAGRRWGTHVCRSGHMTWLDAAHWSPPNTAMPWGPNNDESPGSCNEEVKAYLVTHPDIAMWRLAYKDLYSHWLYGETLPTRYLDASLQHLCGGLTWNQFATLLRSPP